MVSSDRPQEQAKTRSPLIVQVSGLSGSCWGKLGGTSGRAKIIRRQVGVCNVIGLERRFLLLPWRCCLGLCFVIYKGRGWGQMTSARGGIYLGRGLKGSIKY